MKIPMSPAPPFRRSNIRRRIHTSATAAAQSVIGSLAAGDEVTGLTYGQFSLIDIIEHVLTQTGPAHVTVATWTMGIYDENRAAGFCADGRIQSIRWLVDPSFFSRRPELAGRLIEAFGPDNFRPLNIHAKWTTIRGERLAVCIRSSMNLNPNNRIESFDISCCDELTGYFERVVDAVFAEIPRHGTKAGQPTAVFEKILAEYEVAKGAPAGTTADTWAKPWAGWN
ncbi:MAG: hypothetical protein ACREX3_17750 [Gammaproteobacteria bacterium]